MAQEGRYIWYNRSEVSGLFFHWNILPPYLRTSLLYPRRLTLGFAALHHGQKNLSEQKRRSEPEGT